jgi:hypothetical protein
VNLDLRVGAVVLVAGLAAALLLLGVAAWVVHRRHRRRYHSHRAVPPRWPSATERALAEQTAEEVVTTVLPVSRVRPLELSAIERDHRPLGPSVSSLPPPPQGRTPREYRRAGGVFRANGGVGPEPAPSDPVPPSGVVLPVPGTFAESPTARVQPVRRDPA